MQQKTGWSFYPLALAALTLGFAWFDLPGHGTAFVGLGQDLEASVADGHTLFLTGMLAVVALQVAVPRWLAARAPALFALCAVGGSAVLAVYCYAGDAWATAVAVVASGFINVLFTSLFACCILGRVLERERTTLLVVLALAFKTLLVYASNRFLGQAGQELLLIGIPVAAVACVFGARVCLPRVDPSDRALFARPLSTLMTGMLLISSVIFAATRVVSVMGFWGTDYPLASWNVPTALVMTLGFVLLCYFTLVKTDPRLLFRFLPALLTLFAVYAFLYSDLWTQLGLDSSLRWLLSQYAELYGQAFVWAVLLLAMRTLKTPALRVAGILFGAFTVVELLMQRYLVAYSENSLVIVLCSFFAMFGVLFWAQSRFYTIDAREGAIEEDAEPADAADVPPLDDAPLSAHATMRSDGRQPLAEGQADVRRELASARGLSPRETEVFMLLAQGRSRKYICDELFVSPGTASSYTSRVYEKFGVHSKQELLTVVLRASAGEP